MNVENKKTKVKCWNIPSLQFSATVHSIYNTLKLPVTCD